MPAFIAADASSTDSIGYPFQSSILFDGQQYWAFYSNGANLYYTRSNDCAEWDTATLAASGVTNGRRFDAHYAYWGNFGLITIAYEIGSYLYTKQYRVSGAALTTIQEQTATGNQGYFPTVAMDDGGKVILAYCKHSASGGTFRQAIVRHGNSLWSATSLDGEVTIVDPGPGTDPTLIQVVPIHGWVRNIWVDYGNAYLLVANRDATLTGYPYDGPTKSVGAPQAIASGLSFSYNARGFRGLPLPDGRVVALYVTAANELTVKTRSVAGSWGTAQVVSSSVNLDSFTASAVHGSREVVISYARNGVVYSRRFDGIELTSESTVTTQAVTALAGSYLTSNRAPIAIANGASVTSKVIGRTPSPVNPTAFGWMRWRGISTMRQALVARGRVTMVGRVRDDYAAVLSRNSGGSASGTTILAAPATQDIHGWPMLTLDQEGYVYVLVGGSTLTLADAALYKSVRPLDAGGWKNELAQDFTSIPLWNGGSPYVGYSAIGFGADGVLHIIYRGGVSEPTKAEHVLVREYRSGTWSAATTIIDLTGATAYPARFHAATDGTWVLCFKGDSSAHLVKVVPDGDGTFTLSLVDGTSSSPAAGGSTGWTAANGVVYAPSGGMKTNRMAGLDLMPDGKPVVVLPVADASMYVQAIHLFEWSGGAWVSSVVYDTAANMPEGVPINLFVDSAGNTTVITTIRGAKYSRVEQFHRPYGGSFSQDTLVQEDSKYNISQAMLYPMLNKYVHVYAIETGYAAAEVILAMPAHTGAATKLLML